jgi:hypothetical protein
LRTAIFTTMQHVSTQHPRPENPSNFERLAHESHTGLKAPRPLVTFRHGPMP